MDQKESRQLWSEQAERELLAGLIANGHEMANLAEKLSEHDFHEGHHRAVYAAFLSLWRKRAPIGPHSLAVELKAKNQLGELVSIDGCPYRWIEALYKQGTVNAPVRYFAEIVLAYSARRGLVQAGNQILALADEPATSREDVERLLGQAEATVYALGRGRVAGEIHTAGAVVGEFYDLLDRREVAGGAGGVQTGLPGLDDLLGGLQPGELGIVAARPGQGKTALALTVAVKAASAGHRALFVSLEQPRVEILQRLVSDLAGIDTQTLRRGHLNEKQLHLVRMAGTIIHAMGLSISDDPGQRLGRIWADARRLSSQGGLGLVVIDYIQLIEPDSRKEPRHEQVARISRTLKLMARDLQVPVVVAAQLNREVENRSDKKPRLADLRESGSIEADADYVILLHDPGDPPWGLQAIVAKNRAGPVGEALLRFDRPFGRITDPDEVFPRDD